jgi:hypothetical protein
MELTSDPSTVHRFASVLALANILQLAHLDIVALIDPSR